MKPIDVKNFYGSQCKFQKETGMSKSTLGNWLRWGFVPDDSQHKMERITKGKLKHSAPEIDNSPIPNLKEIAFVELKSQIVKLMFSFVNKYSGAANPKNLYPHTSHILVDVLSACLEEAKLQLKGVPNV